MNTYCSDKNTYTVARMIPVATAMTTHVTEGHKVVLESMKCAFTNCLLPLFAPSDVSVTCQLQQIAFIVLLIPNIFLLLLC
jgi:hypothetical protein